MEIFIQVQLILLSLQETGRRISDDCDRLLHMTEASFVRHASRDSSRNWHQGYEDAQRLVLYVEVGARLQGCFLPPPV